MRPGPLNLITDVAGLKVGNAADEGARTGATVVLFPGGWTGAVDVRGGGPGEREVCVLSLENLVGRMHALVLSGGSVFGLSAADGVTAALSLAGEGVRLDPASIALPIVAAAILHDMTNGGDKAWGMDPPYRRLGLEAYDAAAGGPFKLGAAGAGRGARAGQGPGGLGSASLDLGQSLVVGALVAANPLGSVLTPDGETYWAWPFEWDDEFGGRRPAALAPAHDPLELSKLAPRSQPGAATTLALIAVSADLTGPECKRIAIMAHDGLARAVRPSHTPFDGDIVFVAAKRAPDAAADPLTSANRHLDVARIGSAAADVLARAIARGVYEARRSGEA